MFSIGDLFVHCQLSIQHKSEEEYRLFTEVRIYFLINDISLLSLLIGSIICIK